MRKFKPVESAVLVKMVELLAKDATGREPKGVTIRSLSKEMGGTSEQTIRIALNSLKKEGLVESKSSAFFSVRGYSVAELKGKEKIWIPKFDLSVESIQSILKEHPEIEEHVGSDKIQEVLKLVEEYELRRQLKEYERERPSIKCERGGIAKGLEDKIENVEDKIEKVIDETLEKFSDEIEENPELEGILRVFGKELAKKLLDTIVDKRSPEVH